MCMYVFFYVRAVLRPAGVAPTNTTGLWVRARHRRAYTCARVALHAPLPWAQAQPLLEAIKMLQKVNEDRHQDVLARMNKMQAKLDEAACMCVVM